VKTSHAQASFASGEITPRLLGRPDSDIYRTGVRTMENFIARSHGSAEKRGGFETILQRQAEAARVFNFQVNTALAYVVGIVPGTLEVFQASGLIESNNVVANSSFAQGGTGWTVVTAAGGTVSFNATLGITTLVVTGAAASQAEIRQTLTVTAAQPYVLTVTRPPASSYRAIQVLLGTAPGLGDIATFSDSVRQLNQAITPTGSTVHLTVRLVGSGVAGTVVVEQVGFYANTGQTISFPVSYTLGDLRQIKMRQTPNALAAYFVHPNRAPLKLTYNASTDVWTLIPVPFTGAPASWTGSNFPACVEFHQSRSWWAGAPEAPETIVASKSGAPEDLTQGTNADDGMTVTISKKGGILWLMSVKNLLVGTDRGEHIITSTGGILKPGDIQIEQQSAFGSSPLSDAVQVGNSVGYITGDQRKLRLSAYRWEESQWVSLDITFASEHITASGIVSLVWSWAPENLALMADNTGQLIACTYEPTLKIVGWHRHPSWKPFYDFAVQIISGRTIIWAARRVANVPEGGPTQVFFERYDPFIFMDSFKTFVYSTPTTVVTGLDYLEGQTVQVLADGARVPDATITSGTITLASAASHVIVGKQISAQMRLLPWESAGGEQGSTMTMHKRYGKVWARLLTSSLPAIAGVLPPDRSPGSPMNLTEPLKSEDVNVVDLGWNQQEDVTISSSIPFPLFIVSVFGELKLGSN
jgi:hypothetical protein